MVYPYNEILLSNKNELITNTFNNIYKFQNTILNDWIHTQRLVPLKDPIFMTLWKKENQRDRNLYNSCQVLWLERRDWLQKGMRKLFGVMETFYIVMVATWLYAFLKTHQNIHQKKVNSALGKLYPNKPDSKIEFYRLAQLASPGNLLEMLNHEPHFKPIIVDHAS